jgi:hypothetical protein
MMKASHLVLGLIAIGATAPAWATPTVASLGGSITISDANYASGTGWYGNHEDNETETNPTTIKGQDWDLEAMYMHGKWLSLVGGFDFRNGTTYGGLNYGTGDIFIDVNGDAKYGQSTNGGSGLGGNVANTFGYDYVVHFNSTLTSYSVFQINSSSIVSRIEDVPSSNPWVYVSGGTAVAGYQNVGIYGDYGLLSSGVAAGLTTFGSTSLGLQGYVYSTNTSVMDNNHYYLTVNTGFLPAHTTATFHYTVECGNDNLMGRTKTIPDAGASTFFLLGGAMTLLVGLRRKLLKR